MNLNPDEIILIYTAVDIFKSNTDKLLDNLSLSTEDRDNALNTLKICNSVIRKIKNVASENGLKLEI